MVIPSSMALTIASFKIADLVVIKLIFATAGTPAWWLDIIQLIPLKIVDTVPVAAQVSTRTGMMLADFATP